MTATTTTTTMKMVPCRLALASFILGLVAISQAVELTKDTWDDAVAGKAVFAKFFAPWCGHCKNMKPAWDQLMEEFKDSPGILVADVDCTSDGGKPLCQEYGVRGYPTLKYGDPGDLQAYQSGRDFDSLKNFALENLKPACSPMNVGACSPDQVKTLEGLKAMPTDKLSEKIAGAEAELNAAEAEYTEALKKLNDAWDISKKEKKSSISMMKAVKLAASKSGTKDEL